MSDTNTVTGSKQLDLVFVHPPLGASGWTGDGSIGLLELQGTPVHKHKTGIWAASRITFRIFLKFVDVHVG